MKRYSYYKKRTILQMESEMKKMLKQLKVTDVDAADAALKAIGVKKLEELESYTEEELVDKGINEVDAKKITKNAHLFLSEEVKSPARSPPKENPTKEQKGLEFTRKQPARTTEYKFGAKAGNKEHVKFLVLGMTGSGKSTFINAFYNHVKGVPYEKEKYFVIPCRDHPCNVEYYKGHAKEDLNHLEQSQTRDCATIKVESQEIAVTLIDTPGIGDTRGIKQDKENINIILDHISIHADFNAICLVASIKDIKHNALFKYYISEIKSMFPKDCVENLIVCFTKCGYDKEKTALESLGLMGISPKHYFKFENGSLLADLEDRGAKKDWSKGKEAYTNLVKLAAQMKPYSSDKFIEFAKRRREFTYSLTQHIEKIDYLRAQGKEVKKYQAEIQACDEKMEFNKDFEVITEKPESVIDQKSQKRTKCVDCQTLCHNPCFLETIFPQPGDPGLKNCSCMVNDRCKECKCSVATHMHAGYTSFIRIAKQKVVLLEKKKIFESASVDKVTKEQKLKSVAEDIISIQKEIEESTEKIAELYLKIKQFSLLPYNDAYEEYLEMQKHAIELGEPDPKIKKEKIDEVEDILRKYLEEKKLIQSLSANKN